METEERGTWRLDPSRRHQYRWWDGDNWTEQVSDRGVRGVDPLGTEPDRTRERAEPRRQLVRTGLDFGGVAALVGAAIAAVGTLASTVTISFGSVESSTSYFDSDNGRVIAGIAVFAFVVSLLFLLRRDASPFARLLVFVGGGSVLGLAIYDRIDLDNAIDEMRALNSSAGTFPDITVGPSLYLCMTGGVLMMLGALFARRRV